VDSPNLSPECDADLQPVGFPIPPIPVTLTA
jgi:hypothetical protein